MATKNKAKAEYKKITNTSRDGDFVHAGQTMAKDQGFKNVSKKWFDKCLPFDVVMERAHADKKQTLDVKKSIKDVHFNADDDGVFIEFNGMSDRYRIVDGYSITKFAYWFDTGVVGPRHTLIETPKFKDIYDKFDVSDFLNVAECFNLRKRFHNTDKTFLFRVNTKDNSVRCMMSDSYAPVDNIWFLETVNKCIPGGFYSHYKSNGDDIYGNVLIPDSIREEDDSDYGGMVNIRNSEIGRLVIGTIPSLFRAICMNGCIWGQEKGDGIKKKHKRKGGMFDLVELEQEITECIMKQIPLIVKGDSIERFLKSRYKVWAGDGANLSDNVMIAQVADSFKLDGKVARNVLEAYRDEIKEASTGRNNLFGLINGVTRAAQDFGDTQERINLEVVGGKLLNMWGGTDDAGWKNIRNRATSLTKQDIERIYRVDTLAMLEVE